MMMGIEPIWDELMLLQQFPAHKRIAADYPLDLYAEISVDRRPGLLAISSDPIAVPPKYDAVDVKVGLRSDGRWAVSVVLIRSELKPLFVRLCNDVIESGLACRPSNNAGQFVLARLSRWRQLLKIGFDGLLKENEIQGLIGELLFLSTAISIFGPQNGVNSWKGPLDAPRDFECPSGSFEIKTVRAGSVSIHISSIDQLDVAKGAQLTLVVYELIRVDEHQADAITLPGLIKDIRKQIKEDEAASQEFEDKLLTAGFLEHPEYDSVRFRNIGVRHFSVASDFPRLARTKLPHAIVDARYDLLIADCESFIVDPL
jgi:hypothetical protein